jgi:acetyltransferase-like isoleucine patch superfamily enzyme
MKKLIKVLLNWCKLFTLNTFYNNKISNTSVVHSTSMLNLVNVGGYTYIGPNAVINNTQIGNYCSIAPNVVIGGMEHDYTNFSTSTNLCDYKRLSPTYISDDVWIGAGVYVRAGVKLGKGCIIGSNSTVLSDVPDLAIVVGSPAKVLKFRFEGNAMEENYFEIDFSRSPKYIKQRYERFKLNTY